MVQDVMLHPGGRSKADDKVPSSSGSHPSPLGSKTGAESGALSTNDVLKLDMTMFKSRVTVGTSLGQGSFAEVYRAVFDGVPVALKLLSAPKEADEIEKRLVMFFREARALKSCQHPHIAQFYGLVKLPKGVVVGSADMRKRPGPLWAILLELSDGGSLYDLIGQQMANPHTTLYTDNQALAWCLQLASALEHLHSRETMVIHRDVKPSNVLLKLDPHNKSKLVVKLVDFGLHVLLDPSKTNKVVFKSKETGQVLGPDKLSRVSEQGQVSAQLSSHLARISGVGPPGRAPTPPPGDLLVQGLVQGLDMSGRGSSPPPKLQWEGLAEEPECSYRSEPTLPAALLSPADYTPTAPMPIPTRAASLDFMPAADAGDAIARLPYGGAAGPLGYNSGSNALERTASGNLIERSGASTGSASNLFAPFPGGSLRAESSKGRPGSAENKKPPGRNVSRFFDAVLEDESLLDDRGMLEKQFTVLFNLTGQTGSSLYMAPEVYKREPYNEKVDVFSFGIILYELFSRSLITYTQMGANLTPESAEVYAARVAAGFRPSKPTRMHPAVWSLVQRCWRDVADDRPCMGTVVEELQLLLGSEDPAFGTPTCNVNCAIS